MFLFVFDGVTLVEGIANRSGSRRYLPVQKLKSEVKVVRREEFRMRIAKVYNDNRPFSSSPRLI